MKSARRSVSPFWVRFTNLKKQLPLNVKQQKDVRPPFLRPRQTLHSIISNVKSEAESVLHSLNRQVSEVVADCTSLSSLIESHVKEHKECLEVCMSTHQRTIMRALEIAKSSDVVSLVTADKKLKETLCECTHLVSSGAMTPCLSAKNITHCGNIHTLKEILDGEFTSVQNNNNLQTAEVQGSSSNSIKALTERVRQLEESLVKEGALNSELRAQLDAKQDQIDELQSTVQLLEPLAAIQIHLPEHVTPPVNVVDEADGPATQLNAKVVASCDHHANYTPENTLKEGTIGYASPKMPFSGEVFIVYDLISMKKLTKFQLKNGDSAEQRVKTFSLQSQSQTEC
ncbi:hypothetical protein Pelo_19092 [Pelomyxa schiedti]|nr:hypothetical protein Pelo_19092 [Pelomyxa schiedti]